MMSPFVVWSVGVCMLDSPSPRQDMRRYRQPNFWTTYTHRLGKTLVQGLLQERKQTQRSIYQPQTMSFVDDTQNRATLVTRC